LKRNENAAATKRGNATMTATEVQAVAEADAGRGRYDKFLKVVTHINFCIFRLVLFLFFCIICVATETATETESCAFLLIACAASSSF